MKVDTIKGSSYVMTCTKACTVSAIFNSGETSMLILEADKKGQYGFAAPTDAVEVSDEEALITQVFKTAVPGLPGQNGIRQGENAELKNLTAESGTFAGAVNANGGINIPLAVGAATDTSAVNRLYAAGLAAVTDAFSVRCYPLLADCSSSNGTVFKTDKRKFPLFQCPSQFRLYREMRPRDQRRGPCTIIQHPGWVAQRGRRLSARNHGQVRPDDNGCAHGAGRDAFAGAGSGGRRPQDWGRLSILRLIMSGRGRGRVSYSRRGIYYSNAEQKWKMKTTQARAGDVFQYRLSRLRVRGGLRAIPGRRMMILKRGALCFFAWRDSSRGRVKIATVKGVHCFEYLSLFRILS